MRPRTTLRWLGITAFVLAAAGSATAQPSNGSAPDAQVGFERRAQLSPQEELTQSEASLARMEQIAGTVRRQLEQARQARDVVKTLCLNDKLSQIDVAIRSGRDRQVALQAAVQRNDVEMANHEFTILTVLQQRAVQKGAEANQCIGEEYAFVGQTQVTTQVDPNLPGEDTTAFPPADQTLVSLPPVTVSPIQ
jgi:Spy/CpxP family protein refolding chaperone